MNSPKTIRELFSLPGFTANSKLQGVFGDRYSRIIKLRRRKKRLFVRIAGAGAGVGMTSGYVGQEIYWVTMSPTTYAGEMPVMIEENSPISKTSSGGKSIFVGFNLKGGIVSEQCRNLFDLEPCIQYSIAVVAEDLLGRRSMVSDPIYITIPPWSKDASLWRFGDPLDCGNSGCSCSKVDLSR